MKTKEFSQIFSQLYDYIYNSITQTLKLEEAVAAMAAHVNENVARLVAHQFLKKEIRNCSRLISTLTVMCAYHMIGILSNEV